MFRKYLPIVFLAVYLINPDHSFAQRIELLPSLADNDPSSRAFAISTDGKTIVGWSWGRAVKWTENGVVNLAPNQDQAYARSVSGNGEKILIIANNSNGGDFAAYVWEDDNLVRMPGDNVEGFYEAISGNGEYLIAQDISDDGYRVKSDGSSIESIGRLDDGASQAGSKVYGISADGLKIVGQSRQRDASGFTRNVPFIWDGTMQEIPIPFSNHRAEARAISPDGKTISGFYNTSLGFECQDKTSTTWIRTGENLITFPPRHGELGFHNISANGAVITSFGVVDACADNRQIAGYISIGKTNWQKFSTFLSGINIDLDGWTELYPFGVSGDGNIIVGEGTKNGVRRAFQVVIVPTDLIVNVNGDESDANPDDDVCDHDTFKPGKQCTLRAAIQVSEAREGKDEIVINIEEGSKLITITEALPEITDSLSINAVDLEGGEKAGQISGNGLAGDGLRFTGAPGSVRGLSIGGFKGAGIYLGGEGKHKINASFIGSNGKGDTRLPNGVGVFVESADVSIGEGGGNIISGNIWPTGQGGAGAVVDSLMGTGILVSGQVAENAKILGNWIGLDATGKTELANGIGIVIVNGKNVQIGGQEANNTISGNRPTDDYVQPEKLGQMRGIGVLVSGSESSQISLGPNWYGVSPVDQTEIPNTIGVLVNNAPGVTVQASTISGCKAPVGIEDAGFGRMHGSCIALFGATAGQTSIQGNWIGLKPDGKKYIIPIKGITALSTDGLTIGGEFPNIIQGALAAVYLSGITPERPSLNTKIIGGAMGFLADGTVPADAPEQITGVFAENAMNLEIGSSDQNILLGGFEKGIHLRPGEDMTVDDVKIIGNAIGNQGLEARANFIGVWLEGATKNVKIGGWEAGERNFIGGNISLGIAVTESSMEDNDAEPIGTVIAGNWIGLGVDGKAKLGQEHGIYVGPSAFLVSGSREGNGGAIDVSIGVPTALSGGASPDLSRNIISNSERENVWIDYGGSRPGATIDVVNNWIGLDASGEGGVTQSGFATETGTGVRVSRSANVRVGLAGAGNVISGNKIGVWAEAEGTKVLGNLIGTDPAGMAWRGNFIGVAVSASQVSIGDDNGVAVPNVISGNILSDQADDEALGGIAIALGGADVFKFADRLNGAADLTFPDIHGVKPKDAKGRDDQEVVISGSSKPQEFEAILIANNLIGVNQNGDAAIVPNDDRETSAGIWVIQDVSEVSIHSNTISGNGLGLAIGGENIGPSTVFPSNIRIAGNRIGLSATGPIDEFVPNRLGGIWLGGASSVLIGDGAVEGKGPNIIAGSGLEGSGVEPSHRGVAGIYLLHPKDAGRITPDFTYPTGGNTIRQNLIYSNQGLGISRKFNSEGRDITPNSGDNSDGVASFNFPRILQAVEETGGLTVTGTSSGSMTVEVYANQPCDESGFGEGQVYLGMIQSQNGVFSGTVESAPFRDWRISLTGTNSNGTTSEFSPCQPISSGPNSSSMNVAEGETPSLDGPNMMVNVLANPEAERNGSSVRDQADREESNGFGLGSSKENRSLGSLRLSSHLGAGTLYAGYHESQPDSGAYSGSGISNDGTIVAPNIVRKNRFWSLQSEGLANISYETCLKIESLPQPEKLVVVSRRSRGEAWVPHDSSIRDVNGEQYLCATNMSGFGEISIAADEAVVPLPVDPRDEVDPLSFSVDLYPNPSQGGTTMRVDLVEPNHVTVLAYDNLGRKVATLHDSLMKTGRHLLRLRDSDLAAGTYHVVVKAGDKVLSKRLVLSTR